MFRRSGLALAVSFVLASPVVGSARLPQTVSPTFEAIDLALDPSKPDYSGTVRIDLHASAVASEFALHARGMDIKRLELRSKDKAWTARNEARADDILAILPADPLPVGDYTLTLEFARKFDTQAAGLYRTEHEGHAYAFTDFEPIAARQAFPCFDEPAFKIPFQITLTVPKNLDAVTNSPVESEKADGGQKTIVFRRTPPLSTYLIAVAVGSFDFVPMPGTSIPTRVVTVKGKGGLAKDTVRLIPDALAALERYFDRKYPFEKLDFLALPEFPGGAMENPGAITFTDSILLLDPADSGPEEFSSVLGYTSHELAHMWFGDLVTMEWWDDLWLNEAFAEWMGNKIVDEIHPEFRSELEALRWIQSTMDLDARPSSPAIRKTVDDPQNVFGEYDLTYAKGMCVLGMFERWMGPETFRKGVLDHLQAHEWKNARAADLWDALGRASGKDVGTAMLTFLDQGGLPLVTVEPLPDGSLRVSQQRFLKAGVQAPAQSWKIPVVLRTFDGTELHDTPILLDGPEMVVPAPGGKPLVWILPNGGAWGYYRWNIPPTMLEKLADDAAARLSLREQIALLGNLKALLDAGHLHGDDYLRLLHSLAANAAPEVLASISPLIRGVKDSFVTADNEDSYDRFLRSTLGPALDRIGLAPVSGEQPAVTMLRSDLWFLLADEAKDTRLLTKAEELAKNVVDSKGSVDPSLVETVVKLSAIRGDKGLFNEYRHRFEKAATPSERSRYLHALAYFKLPDLQAAAMEYSLKGPLKSNEVLVIPNIQQRKEELRNRLLDWLTENYETIVKRIPPDYIPELSGYASGCSTERLDKAAKFFSDPAHQVPGTEENVVKLKERVRDCQALRDREGKAAAEFLQRFAEGGTASGSSAP